MNIIVTQIRIQDSAADFYVVDNDGAVVLPPAACPLGQLTKRTTLGEILTAVANHVDQAKTAQAADLRRRADKIEELSADTETLPSEA